MLCHGYSTVLLSFMKKQLNFSGISSVVFLIFKFHNAVKVRKDSITGTWRVSFKRILKIRSTLAEVMTKIQVRCLFKMVYCDIN